MSSIDSKEQSSHNGNNKFTPDKFWKLAEQKFAELGIPGAAVAVSLNYARIGKWQEAAKYIVVANLLWILSKIIAEIAPIIIKRIKRLITGIDESLSWENFVLKRRYLDALNNYCYDLGIEGFGEVPPLALEDIFVTPFFCFSNNNSLNISVKRDIWSMLPKAESSSKYHTYRRILIEAGPGYGKTTLTRYLTFSYASNDYKKHQAKPLLPILLVLRSIHHHINSAQSPSLASLVLKQLNKLSSMPKDLQEIPESFFEEYIKRGNAIIMLDGLDEVPDDRKNIVIDWIDSNLNACLSQFVITTRPQKYERLLRNSVYRVSIVGFNKAQKKEFIRKWYQVRIKREKWDVLLRENKIKSPDKRLSEEQVILQIRKEADDFSEDLVSQLSINQALNQLATNPLLITMIAVM